MHQLLFRLYLGDLHIWTISKRIICHSSIRLANPAVGRQEHLKVNNANVINSTLSQNLTENEPASTIPLLDPLHAKSTAKNLELSTTRITEHLTIDKDPLPFEDIPGPTLFKFLAKYWKYVPLMGSFMMSQNMTPLKYLFNKYGPVVRFTWDNVFIHRPEHITKVFDEEGDSPTRSGNDILQHYRLNYRKSRFAGPYNSQGLQSLQWLETKKTLETPVSEQISKQFDKLEMACDELLIRIQQIKNRQDEVSQNFSQELSRWGMESFWILMISKKMGFLDSTGYNESSEVTQLIKTLTDAHYYMTRCETGFQFWRFMTTHYSSKLFSSCDIIDSIIGKCIANAQSNIRNDSLILEETQKNQLTVLENLLVKQRMNPDELSTLLMDMIILGVHATTNTQAFLLYYLAKNPRIQRRLFDEIFSITHKDKNITKKTLDDMPYLNACIKECLRLRPPFPYLTRLLSKSITLHGYKIPEGTYLIMANQISSQREENFEDPEKFKPERWLKISEDSYPKNSYLPFGKGLRKCFGENIAKLQMMLLTTKIIREFRVEYDYADISSRFLMVNVPSKPLRFRFVNRD